MPRLRLPRPAWIVVALLLAGFVSILAVDGFVRATIDIDATAVPEDPSFDKVPADIQSGGPVIDAAAGRLRSAGMPDRTVALTFDDGPDPKWSPEVLRVLQKHGVPGTFFVVGSQVAQYPDVVRQMRAAGAEVGLHTFSHVDLATVPAETVQREMAQTQLVLAGAIGETSYISRPPYSSGASSLTNAQLDTVRLLAEIGQLTVLSDVDSRDWERAGIAKIVASSIPGNGRGGIVLLHDGGGDRTQTIEALDRLIPELKQRGYRFTTVTEGMGLPPANQPATGSHQQEGTVLLTAVGIATTVVDVLGWLLLAAVVLIFLRLFVVVVLAARHKRQRRPDRWTWGRPITEPVSVIVPAYNERECIASTVRSLLAGDHPIEVVVVDDGSTDGTADIVEGLGLPGVRVIRQRNAGKPAALNTGIAYARHDIIVMMDGDTVFEPTTVRLLVQPFADPEVGAVAGNAKIANRTGLVAKLQHIEYVIGFNLDRRAYDLLRCMPTVPGAVGAFRRSALREVGGLSDDTLAEDTDLTMAVCAAGWRVVYEERAIAWTEAPATLSQLWRQRYRWSYGTMQSMWKHRRSALADGNAGRFGRVALAHLVLFQVVLPLLAPLIDVMLVFGLLFLNPLTTLAGWGAVLVVQFAVAALAFRLDRESMRALLVLPLQQVAYRQLMYAVLARSAVTAVGGVRLRWQKMHRSGTANAALAAELGGEAARVPHVPVPVRPAPPGGPVPGRPLTRVVAGGPPTRRGDGPAGPGPVRPAHTAPAPSRGGYAEVPPQVVPPAGPVVPLQRRPDPAPSRGRENR
ncbi:bifunctional polysaccharide deacetylase/glycosyltransferase family 2 protein [Pseudonocardia sp. H11422]|uniref:bifunctional polysaccharide deacetylase/glycosyltransferase family 2 protein n=1 Tax=Pseudonocardia sp. H11422 TaxID=2835866 RepID=UPI001BDC2B81|nr:bifunctional polysaccharide deacetylase/glycosyltransferase family 2 protein [Pseudonocardia sp. H11422]